MLLGEYDSTNFADYYIYWLSVAFMFIIVIVMLNVLIAIVGDSYDATMVKSTELFWRAKVELVAKVSTTIRGDDLVGKDVRVEEQRGGTEQD